MPGKKTSEAPQTVTLTKAEASALMSLYNSVEAADAHYKTCQSELFRSHVQMCYRSPTVASAYDGLKHQLEGMEAKDDGAHAE